METEQKFFVYVDFKEDDGKPFYVGKGVEKRVKDLHRNQLHTNIKNKYGMVRKIVLETQSEQEALQKEIELIQELKTHVDFDEGGANFTLGGDGVSGYKWNEEQLRKMSESLKKAFEKPEYKKKISESVKKVWENPEYKEKMKKTCDSPEHRKKMSEASKKLWDDPEYREKMSEANKKTWENPELREKMSEVRKKLWEDPEHREKMKEIHASPTTKKKKSEASKKLWEDPEHREKISEKIKKAWEKRRLKKLQQES